MGWCVEDALADSGYTAWLEDVLYQKQDNIECSLSEAVAEAQTQGRRIRRMTAQAVLEGVMSVDDLWEEDCNEDGPFMVPALEYDRLYRTAERTVDGIRDGIRAAIALALWHQLVGYRPLLIVPPLRGDQPSDRVESDPAPPDAGLVLGSLTRHGPPAAPAAPLSATVLARAA